MSNPQLKRSWVTKLSPARAVCRGSLLRQLLCPSEFCSPPGTFQRGPLRLMKFPWWRSSQVCNRRMAPSVGVSWDPSAARAVLAMLLLWWLLLHTTSGIQMFALCPLPLLFSYMFLSAF